MGKAGSHTKKKESNTQDTVNGLRKKYEQKADISLIVKFAGDMCDENRAKVPPTLEALNLSTKPLQHHKIIKVDHKGRATLRVHVTRALTTHWYSVNDRVGSVDTNSIDRIIKAIEKI